ncbi:hypothetical protein QYH69_32425 [Paraburkholderia sp. SARCC-3016]|uniref:hypothetical protein n=1 Tax=Paraburkholderia sp. SARCC-3016 TaxID=3058611 RepID=UPI002809FCD7|nr:hypothetical protein [Paraburkholderia sp. SARCC-3016]MDQ7981931.1 hypothetical protein [Paraburkholderia sp. SARCC-3016]
MRIVKVNVLKEPGEYGSPEIEVVVDGTTGKASITAALWHNVKQIAGQHGHLDLLLENLARAALAADVGHDAVRIASLTANDRENDVFLASEIHVARVHVMKTASDMYRGYAYLRRLDEPFDAEAPHQTEVDASTMDDARSAAIALARRLLNEFDVG